MIVHVTLLKRVEARGRGANFKIVLTLFSNSIFNAKSVNTYLRNRNSLWQTKVCKMRHKRKELSFPRVSPFPIRSYMKYVPGSTRNPLLKNGSDKEGREISLKPFSKVTSPFNTSN